MLKATFFLASMALAGSAFAKTETYPSKAPGALSLANLLEGKTLVCVPSETKAGKNDFYPVRIAAAKQDEKNAIVTTITANAERFGFGGEDLTNVEVSGSWVHLSVGDDGRREFMFQYYPGFVKENKCAPVNGDYEGNLAGINSTIWDAGTIFAEGIQCCLE